MVGNDTPIGTRGGTLIAEQNEDKKRPKKRPKNTITRHKQKNNLKKRPNKLPKHVLKT